MNFVFETGDIKALNDRRGSFETDFTGATVKYSFDFIDSGMVTLDIPQQTFGICDINELIDFLRAAQEHISQ